VYDVFARFVNVCAYADRTRLFLVSICFLWPERPPCDVLTIEWSGWSRTNRILWILLHDVTDSRSWLSCV